jgi:hypothetical protein
LALDKPDFSYADLGVQGKRLDQIAAEELPVAEALAPDVIAPFGGGNDVMHRRWDSRTVARRSTSIAPEVVVFTLSDIARRMPLGKRACRIRDRITSSEPGDGRLPDGPELLPVLRAARAEG